MPQGLGGSSRDCVLPASPANAPSLDPAVRELWLLATPKVTGRAFKKHCCPGLMPDPSEQSGAGPEAMVGNTWACVVAPAHCQHLKSSARQRTIWV